MMSAAGWTAVTAPADRPAYGKVVVERLGCDDGAAQHPVRAGLMHSPVEGGADDRVLPVGDCREDGGDTARRGDPAGGDDR